MENEKEQPKPEEQAPSVAKEESGDATDTAPRKRRRKSGWDAPAPTLPSAAPVALAPPTIPTASAGLAIDPIAAQKLAFQKAQEILANSGLNVSVGAPNPLIAAGNPIALANGAALANAQKNYDCRVYVGSLNYSVTEVEIRAIFGSIGPIKIIDMSYDPLTQRSKGYCFIDYEQASDAQAAMGLNGVEIAGRPMKVGRPQGGPNGMTAAQMQAASLAAAVSGTGYGQLATKQPVVVAPPPAVAAAMVDYSDKKTVVLDNMVPVAEASDPDLKGEIEEEAATHGPLKDISIEVVDNSFVRIKLFYLDPPSAMKAYKAMNGRYFGGAVIKASFE